MIEIKGISIEIVAVIQDGDNLQKFGVKGTYLHEDKDPTEIEQMDLLWMLETGVISVVRDIESKRGKKGVYMKDAINTMQKMYVSTVMENRKDNNF